MRLMKLENTPDGRVVSWFSWRDEEQMKMEMRERKRKEKWNDSSQIVKTFKNT